MALLQDKIAEKYKKNALTWYQSKSSQPKYNVLNIESKIPESEESKETENKELNTYAQEAMLVDDIKNAILESSIHEDRKDIYMNVLEDVQEKIKNGDVPISLPDIVKNMIAKPELRDRIMECCGKYSIDGKTYTYLWGLK